MDYFGLRGRRLELAGLYLREGPYWYVSGVNPVAVLALVVGIAPCVPGFVGTVVPGAHVGEVWMSIYHYAWFISFIAAGGVYGGLMSLVGARRN